MKKPSGKPFVTTSPRNPNFQNKTSDTKFNLEEVQKSLILSNANNTQTNGQDVQEKKTSTASESCSSTLSQYLDNNCVEQLNTIGRILMDKQSSLKPLAALSKDDPICFVTNIKFLVPFLMGAMLVLFVNVSL